MGRRSKYELPNPPINVNLSQTALGLLMELYYYSYISEDRLTMKGRAAFVELQRNGLAHLSSQGDPTCARRFPDAPKSCRFVILDKDGSRYARWIEVQAGIKRPGITPNALGLQRYYSDLFPF